MNGSSQKVNGIRRFREGRIGESIEHLSLAVIQDPGDLESHSFLGAAYAADGRFREAVDAFRHALELRPDLPLTHYNLGVALLKGGRKDEALQALRRAVDMRPAYQPASDALEEVTREP